uniref:Uncharacterized protein n=1 Tax=Phaseolus vulgaris TaxID=3885 RepID=V7CEM9_PHAVU|nr:hypothetical protein PHAVU_003G195300g [Phaseolus vulgaris]ESW27361.1 hypothetical protein PHAVU_003G195300g [Phaseolus vulgaris]
MVSELVKRRIHMIAAHFSPKDDISTTHVLPMNCSGSLNSVLWRCDNKVYFARQASSSLGYFMRQTLIEEGVSTFAPKTHHGAGAASECASNARASCFARPAMAESLLKNSVVQPMTPEQGCEFSTLEPPALAKPNRQIRGDQLDSEKKTCYSEIGGWMLQNQKANMLSQWKFRVSVSVTYEWRFESCVSKVDALLALGQLEVVQMLHFLHTIGGKYYMDHMRWCGSFLLVGTRTEYQLSFWMDFYKS